YPINNTSLAQSCPGAFWVFITGHNSRFLLASERGIDRSLNTSRAEFTTILDVVNEERGRVLHASGLTCLALGHDPHSHSLAFAIEPEAVQIQPERFRIMLEEQPHQRGLAPDRLILVKHVVHFPEASL